MSSKRLSLFVVAAAGVAAALFLTSRGDRRAESPRAASDVASAESSAEAVRSAAVTPPQLPRTVRGTRAYVVRNSLGVRELDRAVKDSGVRIVSRLSHAGAIVEATDAAVPKLRACRGIKSVEACTRASKFSPALRERLAKGASGEPVRVRISLVNAADAATVGARIATAGGRVTSQPNPSSRFAWMSAEVPVQAVDALADLAEVKWIEPQGTLKYANDASLRAEELDVRRAWDDISGLGLSGKGQVIGHADTGLDLGDITHLEPEFAGHVKAIYDHTKGAGIRDTNGHGTHTAGSIVGQGIASLGGKYRGVAHDAMLVHQSLGYEIAAAPDDLNVLFAEAYQDGARLHANSWGNENLDYDSAAQSLDEFVWTHPDFLPVFSSGNSGHLKKPTVKSPALAHNVITIGAAEHNGEIAYFSSRGLADENDKRIKPDMLAPGVGIVSVQSMAIKNPTTCSDAAAGTRYCAMSGSSMATPLAAGSLALMREWYLREKGKSPSAAMLMAMAVGGAAARRGTGEVSGASGWGRLAVAATLAPTNGVAVRLRDEIPSEAEHASISERFYVTNSSERLVFSLAWLDYPHDSEDSALLVDYDLAVFAPDGTRHWPNGGTDADHINTRETVVVTNAAPGIWTVTVASPEDSKAGGAVALYACGAFASDASGAKTNVWHVKDGESIQSTVDGAKSGDTIVLEEGTFAPFVATNKLLTIRGAGRDRTVIDGGGTDCAVFLNLPGDESGIVLEGVTIENGFADFGGGILGGTLRHSTIRNCKAQYNGGGACKAVLDRCIVSNCAVVAKEKHEQYTYKYGFSGGGVFESTLYNCLVANCGISYGLTDTDVAVGGSGASYSKLANTTVVGSWLWLTNLDVYYAGNAKSGAVYECDVQNILVSGSTMYDTMYVYDCLKACDFGDSVQSSYVAVVGTNAFVNFAAGDYHLSSNAVAAIDAGCTNYPAFYPSDTDLSGTNRVMGNSVDLGCYESPYTNSLPSGVDLPDLKEKKHGLIVGFAVGIDDKDNSTLGASMMNDSWGMNAFEKGLAGADAARSELVYGEVLYSNFLAAADRIVDGIQSNEVVLLSVSTHGANSEDPDTGVHIAGSWNGLGLYDKESFLWPSNIIAFAKRLEEKGAKLVQVHDSCYSGGFMEMTGLPGVTAATREEISQGPSEGGLFTSSLLETWRHPPADADLNGDGVLSLYELAVATRRTYRGYPGTFYGIECCIYKPEELAKIAVRTMPAADDPVRVITDRMPPAYVSQNYLYRLRAAGASNLVWSAQSALPAGLTLEADGLVHGYPAWDSVTNFSVRVETTDGQRWAETNIVLCGLLAVSNSRPRLVSVSVPEGEVTRRREDGDWTVTVRAASVYEPTSVVHYTFTVSSRGDNTTLTNETNETGTFTVPAALFASWPDVFVTCEPFCEVPGIGISEKCAVWFIRTDVPFPASRAGVCSWSWATNMTTILTEMDRMGAQQMQLSLVPWVKPLYGIDYPASLRETFGKGEAGDVFVAISNKILRGEISVLSTMISFPLDRWTNFAAISNSNGIVCNIATNDTEGTSVSATDPLGLAAWTVNSNLIDQAAAMTRQLGVDYITTEVGYLDKEMWDGTPSSNANENCNIGMARLYEAHRICAKHGVKLLFESGQYSGAETMKLIDVYTNRYASAPFENDYGLTVNDIGINYDVANHLIYANDTPTNAFTAMRPRIAQIHIKDTYEDLAERTAKCGYAGDVKWGTADVSVKYKTLAYLKNAGYTGNLLVEHEWGDDRVGDIKAALQAILLENNEDGSPWIAPQAMVGETMGKCCTAALKAQGFSSSVASALGGVQLYSSFTNWATGKGFAPSNLVSKSGVVLAAALDAAAPPVSDDKVTLEIGEIAIGAELTTLDISYGLEGPVPTSINEDLLKAAIGIEGATNLASEAFSTDNVKVKTNTFPETGRMKVGVQPRTSDSETVTPFFFRAVAR